MSLRRSCETCALRQAGPRGGQDGYGFGTYLSELEGGTYVALKTERPTSTGDRYAAVAEAIISRRSIRRYRPEQPTRALIDSILLTAACAPSAHNRQPWRFRVLLEGREKAALADSMGARLRSDRLTDGDAVEAVEADVGRSRQRIAHAPALILACLSMVDMDRYGDPRRREAEHLMAVQSVAMAGQSLLLACHAAGLGACWLCAPLFCPDVVSEVLDLPEDWQPQGLVTLGYPDGTGKPFHRYPIERIRSYSQ
jgi:coenzyme F420-0:L-glutamate ligase/coenzyme F420-1:gamma-L-glutamate ligase